RLHHDPLRGQAGGHAGSRRVLASHRRARRERPVHGADGVPRDQERGSERDTLHWAEDKLRVPVIDHWWQTETAWPIAANCVGLGMLPVKAGSPTKPVPGYDVHVLGEDNSEMPAGQIGSIALRLPLAPGGLPALLKHHPRHEKTSLTK